MSILLKYTDELNNYSVGPHVYEAASTCVSVHTCVRRCSVKCDLVSVSTFADDYLNVIRIVGRRRLSRENIKNAARKVIFMERFWFETLS